MESLKKGGIFSVQFVSTKGTTDIFEGIGCFFRTPEYLKSILIKYGGIVKLVYDVNNFTYFSCNKKIIPVDVLSRKRHLLEFKLYF